MSQFAKLISILRDLAIIAAVLFTCLAVYKFMVYFNIWDSLPYE